MEFYAVIKKNPNIKQATISNTSVKFKFQRNNTFVC